MTALLCAALLGQLSGRLTALPLSDGGPLGLDDLQVAADGRFVIPEAELGAVRLSTIVIGQAPLDTVVALGDRKVGSAVVSGDLLLAGDRKNQALWVGPSAEPIAWAGQTPLVQTLAAGPDYVRVSRSAGHDEVWVTEPRRQQIEVFALQRKPLGLTLVATLPVAGGPEALEFDERTGTAYTFSENQRQLLAFDLAKHAPLHAWKLECPGAPKGLALDGDGLAFVGCGGGEVLAISLKDGHELSRLATGAGVDIIGYDRKSHRLYVPAATAATLTIASVSPGGALTKLRELPTTARAHCVAVSNGVALVCDPPHGRVLRLDDR